MRSKKCVAKLASSAEAADAKALRKGRLYYEIYNSYGVKEM